MNIKAKISEKSLEILNELNNDKVNKIIEHYVELCKPAKVTILDDSQKSIQYIRDLAVKNNEEMKLATEGHTVHFDSFQDQGRDLENTRVLLPPGMKLSKSIKTKDREEGLNKIFEIMKGIMQGKELLVKFYALGPNDSDFTICALQLTDSAYVVHSEDILYRQGYQDFKKLEDKKNFFHFVHSAGELENNVTKNIDKRRVYMDLEENRVLTVNNQYAGNSVGLKKLALRLAVSKAHKESWLCEHMFIMGAHPEGKSRITYFMGAFPSGCGKTSTAMIPGQTIIGDDIAYIKPDNEGNARAVNVEQGVFGIIQDVNPKDDPLIYKAITTPRELIFSNVLINNEKPYWLGMGQEIPKEGVNYIGEWKQGDEKDGNKILPAHKNARYTIRISELENSDERADDPKGVPVKGIIYGGRDSDTSVPVLQSLSWTHGVYLGAIQESETTATTTAAVGVRKHNPMSNIEFLTVPLSIYIENHIKFGEALDNTPLIFGTNYFIKKDEKFLNEKVDKKVWLNWMEGRIHEEFEGIETPVGTIPKYDDLKDLFKKIFNKDYTQQEYIDQFSIRVEKYLEKLGRVEAIFKEEENIPEIFWEHLNQEKNRLQKALEEKGEIISPFDL